MKLELPLAVVLLAAGCLLWNAQINQPRSSSQTRKNNASNARTSHLATINSQGRGDNSGGPTSSQKDLVQPYAQTIDSTLDQQFDHPVAPAAYVQVQSSLRDQTTLRQMNNDQLTRYLEQAAANLVNSDPIEAKARVTINLFDQSIVATGNYYQKGQGTLQARLEIEQGKGDQAIQIVQLCDGRFNYSLQSFGDKKRLEFVDFEKVSQASQQMPGQLSPLLQPGNWLATGSVSSLIQCLAHSFDFETPTKTELGGISMISIKGHWKPATLKAIVMDLVEPRHLEPDIDWSQIPAQIPHTVEITLGNDQFLPLFPYRIVFNRYADDKSEIQKPVLQLELFEVGKLKQISASLFNINSDDVMPVDFTEKYVQRVNQYNSKSNAQQAARDDLSNTR